jgi:hypothetical protein
VEGAGVAESALEKGGEAGSQTISKQMTAGGDRPLPEVGKEQRWQTTGPSPWAPTVRQLCSVQEQTANHHNTLTGEAG